MKTFVIKSLTNYDYVTQIVNAIDQIEAMEIAKNDGAWEGAEITELDLKLHGLVYSEFN